VFFLSNYLSVEPADSLCHFATTYWTHTFCHSDLFCSCHIRHI